MRSVKFIQILTPTVEGDMMERVDVGLPFWDLGVCLSIEQREDNSFVCLFEKSGKTYDYFINDVKRYLIEH